MKLVCVVFLLTAIVSATASMVSVLPAIAKLKLQSSNTPNTQNACKDNTETGKRACAGSGSWVFCFNEIASDVRSCPEDRPRCVGDGECMEPTFVCPAESGYYPSLTCKSYQICVARTPTSFPCPSGAVYDPHIKSCGRQSVSRPCLEFNCTGRKWEAVRYPGDSRLYTICDGNSRPLAVLTCPLDEVFIEKDMACTKDCTQEGNMKGTEANSFIECVADGSGRFTKTKRTCPAGTTYDANLRYCTVASG